ncbi:hypothetical protein [Glacieibacterium sp.]|uniref:hypothetical protein n=1 Tax=Glacieibacterium sp. TaxID=2860237 RepID=UPI003B00DA4D
MKLLILLAATLGTAAIAAEPPLPLAAKTAAPKTVKAPNPNLVEAKTSTGKTIHYDCSKKGNINKVACKK